MALQKFSVFGLIVGYTFGVIEGNRDFPLEKKHTSIPACYGSTYHSFVNADCSSDSAVTYPYTLFVGAKPKTLNCSTYDNDYAQDYVDGSTLQRDCCKVINLTNDCTDGYNDHNITLFKKQCIAKNKCVRWPVVWKPTHNMSCSNPSEYNEYSNFAYLEYYCIKKLSIRTVNSNTKFSSTNGPLYLTSCDVNQYQNGILERNVTCRISTSNTSTIQVWIMDLRFNPGSTQKVVIGNHLLGSPDANFFKPTLKYDSASSVVNVTFETTSESTEFLWLGFIANNSNTNIEIVCDVREETYISSHTSPLTEDEKKNGMMIAGIGGGIGFLAICVIVGVAIYRRMKKMKKSSQVSDDSQILPNHEERRANESLPGN
uniref:Uncharacterized protein LOC111103094 n=1 Tax=Crassostrea virginica TaxID=6565 RepID=A0A8B8AKZ1_CRAVI|nr:uncharacterized protein LOC111103094 [Crassostrea virginica]